MKTDLITLVVYLAGRWSAVYPGFAETQMIQMASTTRLRLVKQVILVITALERSNRILFTVLLNQQARFRRVCVRIPNVVCRKLVLQPVHRVQPPS